MSDAIQQPPFGWVPPDERTYTVNKEVERVMQDMPLLSAAGTDIAGTGAGQIALLYKMLEKAYGEKAYPILRQLIGDCVSFGWMKGVALTMAVDIFLKGDAEEFPEKMPATEWIYFTSRVLVGKGRLGRGDGSVGAWAAQAVKDHGILFRQPYDGVDLTSYSGDRAKDWGYRGPSNADALEQIADEHPIQQTALVNTYEQARDAIFNGYPVPVCSNQGFTAKRDNDGFCRPSGSWSHCMCFIAADDSFGRPGLLCDNSSWGATYFSGPKRHEQPDGTFWVDADTCNKMLRQNDSFAVSGFKGFPKRNIDWSIW
ncbi:hypothetical protein [Planctomicrobium piriforme]|uniref:Uncharacterized protein n=1 Tax=Planctomicrobium piriforme TaxID=1576369 RepID=A0A1I3EE91_9PLAN|nr:hypothetical protein [Planctomicrobium piriforme]SFH97275.1 hypothetical protein SAMN05421753_104185 [Planctomicrobium piriforme]